MKAQVFNRIEAKPFSEDKYTWYKAKKKMVFRTKKNHIEKVAIGDEVGVRPATSNKNSFRFILKKTGIGLVFTANKEQHDAILKNLKSGASEHPPLGQVSEEELNRTEHNLVTSFKKVFKNFEVEGDPESGEIHYTKPGVVDMVRFSIILQNSMMSMPLNIVVDYEKGSITSVCLVAVNLNSEDMDEGPIIRLCGNLESDVSEKLGTKRFKTDGKSFDVFAQAVYKEYRKVVDKELKQLTEELNKIKKVF